MTRKAIYPGTFDPITLGHVNIAEKAASLFEEVIIGIADYTGKETMFNLEERVRLCRSSVEHLRNVTVKPFKGLVVEFAKSEGCLFLIRGMRAVSDFEYELSLALTNKKIAPEIETLFLVPNLPFMYLSSSMIKQLAELHSDLSDFVTPEVAQALNQHFE
ncbi:MAG TPA: pantetheine-phosphate adenylyltransferase [Candidatus Cloacimonadota bacterium]|nr:pantetheine-phosphate adenylyltransferase [Candidatus Cloacimonadota bacterium]